MKGHKFFFFLMSSSSSQPLLVWKFVSLWSVLAPIGPTLFPRADLWVLGHEKHEVTFQLEQQRQNQKGGQRDSVTRNPWRTPACLASGFLCCTAPLLEVEEEEE